MRPRALVIGAFAGVRGRSMARRRRRRPRGRVVAARIVAAIALTAGLGVGVRWLLTSPLFAVARVESGPYRYTTESELQAALGGCLGRNIWTLSTADVRERLQGLPWVRDLQVRRRLPDAIEVDFREWRPVAELARDDASAPVPVLLENGRVLPFPAHLEPPALPVVVGCADDTGPVLALVEALAATGLEATAPVDFVVCDAEGFTVVLQDDRARLKLGREDFVPRLRRFLVARSQVPAGAEVDLRFRDRVAFLPPEGTP